MILKSHKSLALNVDSIPFPFLFPFQTSFSFGTHLWERGPVVKKMSVVLPTLLLKKWRGFGESKKEAPKLEDPKPFIAT